MKPTPYWVLLAMLSAMVFFTSITQAAPGGKVFDRQGLQQGNAHTQPAGKPADKPFLQSEQNHAMQLYRRAIAGNSLAVVELKQAANNGNRWAALQYGYLAHTGRLPGTAGKPDIALAVRAYNLASKETDAQGRTVGMTGNYLAAYNMGLIYYYGAGGIKPNGAEALRWFQAAEGAFQVQGRSNVRFFWPALVYLAQIHERGYGVTRNPKLAFGYWEKAAKSRDGEALYGYAMAIATGQGGIQNPYRAYPLLVQSAKRWNINAMLALARYQAQGDKVREANKVDAAKWLLIAATADKRYRKYADRMLATLSAQQQKQAASQTRSWLSVNGGVPDKFDYRMPVNETVSAIR